MFNKKKAINLSLLISLLFMTEKLSAQTTFDEMRKIPVPSPEAASLTKAVEFPVSFFNGRPDISIPLYNVNSGDIDLPISLTYNSGGVRVSEEASMVGLGWALNVGGVITHEIKGGDDDNGSHLFNAVFPVSVNNQYSESYSAINKVASQGIFHYSGVAYTNVESTNHLSSQIGGEPDLYIYNFGKYSGKFLWLSSTEVADLSNNNVRFVKDANSIIATTPDGFRYEFSAIELAVAAGPPTKIAYYLTKIISANKSIITLNYKTFRNYVYPTSGPNHVNDYIGIGSAFANNDYVRQMPLLSEEYIAYVINDYMPGSSSSPPQNSGLNRTFTTSEIRNLYLDKISFNNGSLEFIHGSRKDLFGMKLDGFKVYNDKGSVIKNINFQFGYFTSKTGFESYTTPGNGYKVSYDESYRKTRLKLKGLTIGPESYKFQYYEGADGFTLPYKSSFAQDYWGYYNGAIGNTTLIPDFRRYNFLSSIPSAFVNWIGADRDAHVENAIEGSLKRIEYPTKGFSEFAYDMNEYSNGPSTTVTGHKQVGALNTSTGVTITYLDIPTDTYADINVSLFCNAAADANPSGAGWDCQCVFPPSCNYSNMANSMYVMIEKINPANNQAIATQWQYDFGKEIVRNSRGFFTVTNACFTAGRYKLTANYPDNKVGEIGTRMAYILLNIPEVSSSSGGKGGGLRISSVKAFDPVKKQYSTKEYKYEQGLMMKFPRYYSSLETILNEPEPLIGMRYTTHTLYSEAVFPSSFSANGSPVGYGKVTESYSGNLLGRTEYQYIVKPDKLNPITPIPGYELDYIPGTPSTAFIDNGFLSLTTVYNKDNVVVKTIYNTPRIEYPKTYWAFKKRLISEGGYSDLTFPGYVHLSFYPIQVGKLQTGTTRENLFGPGGTISSLKEFEYTDKGYLKLEKQTVSNGTVLSKHFAYPTDFSNGISWIDELKLKNIIEKPLEVITKRNDNLVSGSFVTYKAHDDIISPHTVYKAETLRPTAVPSIFPSGIIPADFKVIGVTEYDTKGNIKYSKATENISFGYKWGYGSEYQIAVCENATDSEFLLEDFEGSGRITANTASNHTGKGAFNGSINLSNYFDASLNNRSYRLSYFKNDGDGWKYFDLAYSGQSISGLVDDIRIYPRDGLITSFTYEPLVGMKSSIDSKGYTTFYEYDNFNRLATIKDQKSNTKKTYQYSYSPTLGRENNVTYGNVAITQFFTKQCSLGTGSRVAYSVSEGQYTSESPEEANALAQAEIAANGQNWANSTGTCAIFTGPPVLKSVVNGQGTDLIINYEGPSGANSLLLFIKDVATGQIINNHNPFFLSTIETSYKANVPKGKQYDVWLTATGQYYPQSMNSQIITVTLP